MDVCAVVNESLSKADGLSGMQLSEIRGCYTADRATLDGVLKKMGLFSVADKSKALLMAMRIGDGDSVFYSGSGDVDVDGCDVDNEQQYEAVVGAFFSGFWA